MKASLALLLAVVVGGCACKPQYSSVVENRAHGDANKAVMAILALDNRHLRTAWDFANCAGASVAVVRHTNETQLAASATMDRREWRDWVCEVELNRVDDAIRKRPYRVRLSTGDGPGISGSSGAATLDGPARERYRATWLQLRAEDRAKTVGRVITEAWIRPGMTLREVNALLNPDLLFPEDRTSKSIFGELRVGDNEYGTVWLLFRFQADQEEFQSSRLTGLTLELDGPLLGPQRDASRTE